MVPMLFALTVACTFDAQTMDLRSIDRSSSPNDSLACPPGLCRAKADFQSPIFALEENDLMKRVEAVLTAEPRTALVGKDPALDQLVFVQRSALFGFPDTIWIQATDVDQRTSLIVYSRANYGYWDLGVNRDRVRGWLEKLVNAIARVQGREPR